MKITKEGIKFEKGEPSLNVCWECDSSNEHLKNSENISVCLKCKRYFIFGRYLSEFKTDEELEKWLKKKLEEKNE